MADRRQRNPAKRRKLNSSDPKNMTIEQLKSELNNIGIVITGNLNANTLRKILSDNSARVIVQNTPASDDQVNDVDEHVQVHNENSSIDVHPEDAVIYRDVVAPDIVANENNVQHLGTVVSPSPQIPAAASLQSLSASTSHVTNKVTECAVNQNQSTAQPLGEINQSTAQPQGSDLTSVLMSTLKFCQDSMAAVTKLAESKLISNDKNNIEGPEFSLKTAMEAYSGADKQPTGTQINNLIRGRPASMGSTFEHAKGKYGIMPASIPITDMVSNEIRKLILSGQDVNLNIMLIPNYVKTKETDERLDRSLSLDEFIVAFGRYKRIMVREYPLRSQELDDYLQHVIETANTWPEKFYEYHRLFSAKCAIVLQQHNKQEIMK